MAGAVMMGQGIARMVQFVPSLPTPAPLATSQDDNRDSSRYVTNPRDTVTPEQIFLRAEYCFYFKIYFIESIVNSDILK